MNIQEIPKLSSESKKWFLDLCMERFGSMTKKEYEVAIFHLLLENGFRKKSDFDISRLMRITESKVKTLRYESELVYPTTTDYKSQLIGILKESTYKTDGRRIQFAIKDKLLRLYANSLLEEDGNFSDSSFNSNIVSLTYTDMAQLIVKLYGKKDGNFDDIMRIVRKSTNLSEEEMPKTFEEEAKNLAKAFIQDATQNVAPNIGSILAETLVEQAGKIWYKINGNK